MRKLGALVLIFIAFSSYADKSKVKSKDKRFESVEVQAAGVIGSYRGPAESYGLILEAGTAGVLRGNYVEMGRVAVLNAVVVKGAEFTARASFADGTYRTIRGTFANRVLNGKTTFGVRMESIPIDGLGSVDTFFERF
ncbi:MAG TPA: hypothetical protein VFT12_10365 [Thermoanaerobaculia bacterium]|nr:hypothetical protein [Thermoanaerobaculia bacterium]